MSSNILHTKKDISETISKVNCLRICHIAMQLPDNFLALGIYNAQISIYLKYLVSTFQKLENSVSLENPSSRFPFTETQSLAKTWTARLLIQVPASQGLSPTVRCGPQASPGVSISTVPLGEGQTYLAWVILHPATSPTNGRLTYLTIALLIIVQTKISVVMV